MKPDTPHAPPHGQSPLSRRPSAGARPPVPTGETPPFHPKTTPPDGPNSLHPASDSSPRLSSPPKKFRGEDWGTAAAAKATPPRPASPIPNKSWSPPTLPRCSSGVIFPASPGPASFCPFPAVPTSTNCALRRPRSSAPASPAPAPPLLTNQTPRFHPQSTAQLVNYATVQLVSLRSNDPPALSGSSPGTPRPHKLQPPRLQILQVQKRHHFWHTNQLTAPLSSPANFRPATTLHKKFFYSPAPVR